MTKSSLSDRVAATRAARTSAVPIRDDGLVLEPALNARRRYLQHDGYRIALYESMPQCDAGNEHLTPLLLVHSINAASSAAEVRPLFERYAASRPVVAIELPGFGSSERRRALYTPPLMSGCIVRVAEDIHARGFHRPIDVMAVSLSCELAARAVLERPGAFRSLALISPTGFDSRRPERYEGGRTKDKPWLRWLLESGPWSNALFRLLTSEKSMRKFLERTWGSKQIDEGLLAYNLLTVAQPGARHAPYAFIAGSLFTRGVMQLYERLKLPVWLIHGSRGEFAKVPGLRRFAPSEPWAIEEIDAGAMPYFERPAEFTEHYDAFAHTLERGAQTIEPPDSSITAPPR